jgi:heat shock protein HslJ
MLIQSLALVALAQPTQRLENRTWEVTAWRENGAIVQIAAPITATFTDPNTISGSTGCNLYSGKYKLQGGRFILGQNLLMTKRGCTEVLAGQETRVLDMLRGGRKLTFDPKGNLVLRYKTATGTGSLTLTDRVTLLPSLAQSQWRLVGMERMTDGGLVSEGGSNAGVTLSFGKREFRGFGGCNNYQGNYVQKRDRLTLSNLTFTERACLPLSEEEPKFFEALGQVDRFDVDSESTQLTFIYPKGKLIFSRLTLPSLKAWGFLVQRDHLE